MPHFICVTCGSEHAESGQPPARCPICEDERQWVPPGGQQWTTLADLHRKRLSLPEWMPMRNRNLCLRDVPVVKSHPPLMIVHFVTEVGKPFGQAHKRMVADDATHRAALKE